MPRRPGQGWVAGLSPATVVFALRAQVGLRVSVCACSAMAYVVVMVCAQPVQVAQTAHVARKEARLS